MPRPGPRPYECVRRAWHRDIHQPIRGSLIQEIFRIANESHSSAVKKNREWQEKLPVVVLKAEEIMYSKANSEAEYTDFDTVWERAIDAIDTIIRREDNTETGELLQPCIEAALHLGCTPRRSSRSQRNIIPQFYLTPRKNEPVSTRLSNMHDEVSGDYAANCSFMPGNLNFLLRKNTMDSSIISGKSNISTSGYLKSQILQTPVSSSVLCPCQSSNPCSVYPLYYGNQFPLERSKAKATSNIMEVDTENVLAKLTSSKPHASNVTCQANFLETSETPYEGECDLSLRLGPLVLVHSTATENNWPQELECRVRVGSQVGSKPVDLSWQMDKAVSSNPENSCCEMLDLSSTEECKSQNFSIEANFRKRKVAVSHPSEAMQFCRSTKLPFKQCNQRINNASP